MPAEQERMRNPFDMDEACPACPELVETRDTIVHGYGDVAAEFFFVAEQPTMHADATGIPIDPSDEPATDALSTVLSRLGFLQVGDTDTEGNPVLENAYLTHLTRCRHPDRGPTDPEIGNCEAFLSAELRTINPEILIPIGERALTVLADEHTTEDANALSATSAHATELRGRGFELVPMADRTSLTDEQLDAFVETMEDVLGRDYRQTKGRRSR